MKKRFSEAQIIGFLREAEAGLPVKQVCRRHGFSEGSYYLWRNKFGGMTVSDAKLYRHGFLGQPGECIHAAVVSANARRTTAGARKPSRSINHCWL